MGQPAARIADMHMCPMVTPGLPPIPHVGGPINGPGCPTVLIGGMPAAVVGDFCTCVGAPDSIVVGSTGVFFGGKAAARVGDACAHGGKIMVGFPSVLIGETGTGEGVDTGATSVSNSSNTSSSDNSNPIDDKAMEHATGSNDNIKKSSPEQKIETDCIECRLVDEDGEPIDGMKYEITLPNGSVKTGKTDKQGAVKISGIPRGICKVSFPDIHADEWY